MAELIFNRVGAAIGGRVLGGFGRVLGGAVGAIAGRSVDAALFGETRTRMGPRTAALHLQGSSEGASVPITFGRMRVAGQVIWASRFTERSETTRVRTGGKGGPRAQSTTFRYSASFAVGLCEGPIARIERIWANGQPIDLSGFAWRLHPGGEDQAPDPLIEAIEGAANAPAYRGLAYVVFEDMPLDRFGDTIPHLSFEVVRTMDSEPLERLARGVCLIPGAGEFAYATQIVRRSDGPGRERAENMHVTQDAADLVRSLDQLERDLPGVRSVNLVIGWFGDDLRCGSCRIRPGVEVADKATAPFAWRAGGVGRAGGRVVSRVDGRPAYGGTPSDQSVAQAIAELKRRGFSVGIYPFLFMDVPAGNALPDPYGAPTQPAYPWRGRITASVAPGRPSSPDKTAAAAAEVAAFFGHAQASQIGFDGEGVTWSGGEDWGYRRFILSCARLAAAVGGVDRFVIGSELRGLTTLRSGPETYPAPAHLAQLAADVRTLLPGAKLTYAADWSEYFGHQPADGTGDVFFHLDPLWAHPAIDAVGIDWYPPLTDARDGEADAPAIRGGEHFDWFYASDADRRAKRRTPITDGASGKPWVFRPKDLLSWWSEPHYDRPGGVERTVATDWIPKSKPIWLVELGCPAIDKGANSPNLFVDPKSSESFVPPFSTGARDDLVQRRALEAYLTHYETSGAHNPISPLYGGPMVAAGDIHLWCWDARPFPAFPGRADVWGDAPAWGVGHWLNGRAGGAQLGFVVRDLCARAGVAADVAALEGVVPGLCVEGANGVRGALEALAQVYGFGCVESAGALTFKPLDVGAPIDVAAHDCVLDEQGGLSLVREAAGLAPREARLRFADPARDYAAAVVSARGRDALGRTAIEADAGLALDPTTADALAQRLLAEAEADGARVRLVLPRSAPGLEAGDLVRLSEPGFAGAWRVRRVEEGVARTLSLSRAVRGVAAAAAAIPAAPAPTLVAKPQLVLLDVPLLPGREEDERPLAAVFAEPWPGPVEIFAGADAGSATLRAVVHRPAAVGELLWGLWPGPAGRWDDGNVVRLRLPGATLASVDENAVLSGANTLAVFGPAGWELISCRTARLVGENTYEISGLLRCLAGTDKAMASPTPAGSIVVQVDERLVRATLGAHEAEDALSWFAAASGHGPGSVHAAAQSWTWTRQALQPLSPAHVQAQRLDGGGLLLSWTRRGRIGADAWAGEIPLGEEREAYRLEILGAGGAPLRTIETAAPEAVYALSEQIADFGGPPTALAVRVAQFSSRRGFGQARESILWL